MARKTRKLWVCGVLVACVLLIVAAQSLAAETKTFKWRMQTYAVPGTVGFKGQEMALARLKKATEGRLDIKIHGVGVLVGATEQLDACGKGLFEVVHNPDAYSAALDPGFAAIFSAIGLWDDTRQVRVWLEGFGGNQIITEAYAKYNVHFAGATLVGAEPIMSNKPLRKLEDFKGLKIRTPSGLTSMLFTKLGAAPVPLPGGEIYTALDSKVIDAAEFVSLGENVGAGFHQVTKTFLWPSFHGPIAVVNYGVNKKAWDSLPDDLKAAFEAMVYEADYRFDVMSAASDIEALKICLARGMERTQLSAEDMEKARQISVQVAMEYKQKSPLSDKVITSILDYLKKEGKIK